jgi:hypothetical protein
MNEPRRESGAARIAVIVFVVVVAIVVGGALVLRAVLTPERLRAEVVRAASDATGLNIDLDDARLSLVPFGVSVRGLRAGEGAAGSDDALLELDSGLVRLDLGPLLRKNVVIEEIRLERPRLSVRKYGGEILLPGKLGAEAAGGADGPAGRSGAALPAAGLSGSIRKLEIVDGSLLFDSDVDTEDLVVDGIALTASLDVSAGGEIVTSRGELALEGLDLPALEMYRETLDTLHPKVRFDLEFRRDAGVLDLGELAIVAGPADVRLRGEVSGVPDFPIADLALAPETFQLAELLPLVPPGAWPEGRAPTATGPVTVSATVRGPLTDPDVPPEIAVTLDFGGADVGLEGFAVGVQNVTGKIAATPRQLTIESLEGRVGDGRFAIHGDVTNLEDPERTRYDLGVTATLDLGLLESAGFAPEGVAASGQVEVDLRASGAAADPQGTALTGTVELANGGLTTPELPVPLHDLTARVRLAEGDATLEALSGSLGRSSFEATGVVENAMSPTPRIRIEGTSPLLDLAELAPAAAPASRGEGGGAALPPSADAPLIPPLPPVEAELRLLVDSLVTVGGTMSDVELAATITDGKARVEASVAQGDFGGILLTSLRADLDLEGQTARGGFWSPRVEAHRVPLTRVRGDLDLGADRVLRVENVAAGLWTGAVEGRATVDLTELADPAFTIETTATGVEANDVVSTLTGAKDLLHGQLNLRSSFSGRGTEPASIAQRLTGSGDFDATGGRIERTPAVEKLWNTLQFGGRSNIPYKDLSAAFSVRDGRLVTDDVVIDSGEALWRVSGAAAFDGTLDYDVEVELGERLSDHYKKQIGGQLGALLANTDGRLVLNLEIRGPAAKPSVTVDQKKLLERAQKNAANALQQKLKDEGDNLVEGLKGLLRK